MILCWTQPLTGCEHNWDNILWSLVGHWKGTSGKIESRGVTFHLGKTAFRTWPWENHTGTTNISEDITNIPEQSPSCSCSNHGCEASCFNCSSIYMSAQHKTLCLDRLLDLARCKIRGTKPFSPQHHFSSVISLKTNKTNPGLPLNNLRDTWLISRCWVECCVRRLKLDLVFSDKWFTPQKALGCRASGDNELLLCCVPVFSSVWWL